MDDCSSLIMSLLKMANTLTSNSILNHGYHIVAEKFIRKEEEEQTETTTKNYKKRYESE